MKKIIQIIPALLILTVFAKAQVPLVERTETTETKEPKTKSHFMERVYFGGSFGLQFGTQTYIELAPIAAYRVTDRLSTGLALKYQYYKYKDDFSSYSSSRYGGGPFAQFTVFEGLFLHGEIEILNMEVPDPPYYINLKRENVTSVFVGGGYRQMMGERSAMDLLLLWNINESVNSPYVNPIIRIGFGFGI